MIIEIAIGILLGYMLIVFFPAILSIAMVSVYGVTKFFVIIFNSIFVTIKSLFKIIKNIFVELYQTLLKILYAVTDVYRRTIFKINVILTFVIFFGLINMLLLQNISEKLAYVLTYTTVYSFIFITIFDFIYLIFFRNISLEELEKQIK